MIKDNFVIPNGISLYIHIPFCHTKCFYCDFNTYTKLESLIPSYIKALKSELDLWSNHLHKSEIKSIFIGGGTPSYIPANYIKELLNTIFSKFNVRESSEITLESNPNDLSKKKLNTYKKSGINRISMGVQSFDDSLLQDLGRRHSQQNAIDAYYIAKEAGFENISLDLMYGLPKQNIKQWIDTLSKLLTLKPLHVSMYGLTLEEGTPMHQWVKDGQLIKPNDDIAADMYIKAVDIMCENQYLQYEISNWAIPGFESKHNLNYWNNNAYLGIGPGAHSYIPPYRFSNIKSPREYTKYLNNIKTKEFDNISLSKENLKFIDIYEKIDKSLEISETIMLGLRLNSGIKIKRFIDRFAINPLDLYSSTFNELKKNKLLEFSNSYIKLTPKGRLLSNVVFLKFF